jgi:hypothetical protein
MMLNQLTEQIHECHEHAIYCARKAAQQTNRSYDKITLGSRSSGVIWRGATLSPNALPISQVKQRCDNALRIRARIKVQHGLITVKEAKC